MQIQIKPGVVEGQIRGCRAEDAEHFGVYTVEGHDLVWFADFKVQREAEEYATKLAKFFLCETKLVEGT